MLLYHPATDFYHCWMRFASVLCDCGSDGVEFDRILIIDFLLCFPLEINECKLPAEHSAELSKQIRRRPKSYEDPNSIRQAFAQMNKIQRQVAMDMVTKGIVQRDKYREGLLTPNSESSASGLLRSAANEWDARNEEWYKLTVVVLLSMPLNGKDGLKDRSGLLEFRYDG